MKGREPRGQLEGFGEGSGLFCFTILAEDFAPRMPRGWTVGILPHCDEFSTFKQVDPSRLSFTGVPGFDPSHFLDEGGRRIYEEPIKHRRDPKSYTGKLPKLKVHCSFEEKVRLFELLDSTGRLDGLVRGSLKRAVPLVGLLLRVVKVGYATGKLLEILAGSIISLMLFRRRLLSMLDSLFASYRGRDRREIVALDGRTRSDLLCICVLLPLCVTNLRSKVSPRITATDASNWGLSSCGWCFALSDSQRGLSPLPSEVSMGEVARPREGLVESSRTAGGR